jgi:DinB superfamily
MTDSPAWKLDAWELSSDLAKIEQQWATVHEILEDPVLYEARNSAVSAWSCGEQAGHLTMVTRWVAKGIEENLATPDRDVGGEWTDRAGPILEAGAFPRGVAQAPPQVNTLGKPREPFLAILADTESRWKGIAEQAAQLPDCPARFQHFALGFLTSTEWVRFCALHTAHHLALVRDIRAG